MAGSFSASLTFASISGDLCLREVRLNGDFLISGRGREATGSISSSDESINLILSNGDFVRRVS